MRVAVLVKQVPKPGEQLVFTADGRLNRTGVALEMNAYCRRAVSKGVEIAQEFGGTCTVFTLGPAPAEDCLREAVAWGADDGVLVSDAAFAGSDTLATARALGAALEHSGGFDVVLVGQNSVDADTGHVGPGIAQLLGLPFLGPADRLALEGRVLTAHCHRDDGWLEATVELPAVVACAERLCEPCKMPPDDRAAVPASRVTTLTAAQLGSGPWGVGGSPTRVGRTRTIAVNRRRQVLSGDVETQVRQAVQVLLDMGALDDADRNAPAARVPHGPAAALDHQPGHRTIAVLLDPHGDRVNRELLGKAAELSVAAEASVVGIGRATGQEHVLGAWGADVVVSTVGSLIEEDVAADLAPWCAEAMPWAMLLPGTLWGREVGARLAVMLGAGLVGDAVELEVEGDRLTAWKPAYGNSIVAAITSTSPVQMATVRPGVMPLLSPRECPTPPPTSTRAVPQRSRVRHLVSEHLGGVGDLSGSRVVVGVGMGVVPAEYAELDPLLEILGAELAATRKVTDRGWLPRSLQVGITGHSISPRLYVVVGSSGKTNHMMGVRTAGSILAINTDPDAEVFEGADVGIVGDWRSVVPHLVAELAGRRTHA